MTRAYFRLYNQILEGSGEFAEEGRSCVAARATRLAGGDGQVTTCL